MFYVFFKWICYKEIKNTHFIRKWFPDAFFHRMRFQCYFFWIHTRKILGTLAAGEHFWVIQWVQNLQNMSRRVTKKNLKTRLPKILGILKTVKITLWARQFSSVTALPKASSERMSIGCCSWTSKVTFLKLMQTLAQLQSISLSTNLIIRNHFNQNCRARVALHTQDIWKRKEE